MRIACSAPSISIILMRAIVLAALCGMLFLLPSIAAGQSQSFAEEYDQPTDAPVVPLATEGDGAEPAPEDAPVQVSDDPAEDAAPVEATEPADVEPPVDEPALDENNNPPTDEPKDPRKPEAAEFNGITPGVSTAAEVQVAWGKPKTVERADEDSELWTYEIEPFPSVIVALFKRHVESIVINLAESYSAAEVEQQLGLADIDPALVRDEVGDALGQAYPERGVLLSFDAAADEPHVIQVILEAVGTELFLARAEDYQYTRPLDALADLDQVLVLDPETAIAYRLKARILAEAGHWTETLAAAQRAIRGEPQDCEAHLLSGIAHAQLGDTPTALKELKIAAKLADSRPEIRARATAALGDLYAATPQRDFQKAIELHQQAMKEAEPLMTDPRQIARDQGLRAMVDGHLGAAYDVAWGNWQGKNKVAPMWLKRAQAYVDASELTETQALEFDLHIARAALSACVGLQDDADAEAWIDQAVSSAKHLLAGTDDQLLQKEIHWQLGRALYDGLQIAQMKGDQDAALDLGQKSIAHLEAALEGRDAEANQAYLVARLYFRVGSIYALHVNDHATAAEWFDKAMPVLTQPLPPTAAVDLGRHGESLVSMGVSLWEQGRRDEAMELTLTGADLMKEAVSKKLLTATALAVPYSNLSSMHEQLGDAAQARKFENMAADPARTLRE